LSAFQKYHPDVDIEVKSQKSGWDGHKKFKKNTFSKVGHKNLTEQI